MPKIEIAAITLAYLNATVFKGQASKILEARISDKSPFVVEIVYELKKKPRPSKNGSANE